MITALIALAALAQSEPRGCDKHDHGEQVETASEAAEPEAATESEPITAADLAHDVADLRAELAEQHEIQDETLRLLRQLVAEAAEDEVDVEHAAVDLLATRPEPR